MANYGLQQIFEESVSACTATPTIALGTERWENGKKYRYVYNASTSTCNTKLGVVYSTMTGYSITASSVIGNGCAGVVVHTQLNPAEYGWVCTRGHVAVTAQRATVANQAIIMGTMGNFDVQTGATGGTGVICGWATGSTAATATFGAWINVA